MCNGYGNVYGYGYGYGARCGYGAGYGVGVEYGYARNVCDLLNIRQGDRIAVRSAGRRIGDGIFIRTQGRHIVWTDECNNSRVTDITAIDLAKLIGCTPCPLPLSNAAPEFVD